MESGSATFERGWTARECDRIVAMEGPMPWTVSYSPDLAAVTTVYSGRVKPNELQEAVRSTLQLAREHGTRRFLADCAELQGGHSVSDLYAIARMLEAEGLDHGSREALLLPQLTGAVEDVRFWETVCLNRGYTVRVFERMADATEWLAGCREPKAKSGA